jgi:hypothetical protein
LPQQLQLLHLSKEMMRVAEGGALVTIDHFVGKQPRIMSI